MAYFGCCGVLKGESMINYSTSEQNTGIKWIDGRNIYQKTIEVQESDISGGTHTYTVNGLEMLIDAICTLKTSYSGSTNIHITPFSYNPYGDLRFRTNEVILNFSSGETYEEGYITVWYVKPAL